MPTHDDPEHLRAIVPSAPEGRIARHPAQPRDSSLLLVASRAGELTDSRVSELARHLRPGDLLVLNETRVLAARLTVTRSATGGRAELLFLPPLAEERRAWAMLGTRGHPRPGEVFELGGGHARFRLIGEVDRGRGLLELSFPEAGSIASLLDAHGTTPLPPYILRAREAFEGGKGGDDHEGYQTVFARVGGAVAAPTAGLHFSEELIRALEVGGVGIAKLTLHVGPGTFLPVRASDPRDHPMEPERAIIPEETARAVARTRASGGRVIAVGTTCTRALESSAARNNGMVVAGEQAGDIFIYPPYHFRIVDGILTNFHLPDSTPVLLVAAMLGRDLVRRAYEHALAGAYRFYSYGDAMLVLPAPV